ncbi:hypothetical protein [Periweissella ghanensis]|uniref:DUF86 domain-containing protein n=1 Tax=Periweissella ghanensis TaxID=467997 RepID=A0ABM8ZD48_9LACO|nr:hypothetical protein [Periweissella ghanensis]MCM0600198.1 hypothetical protein [Periweissella ghanensis]CAH0419087.1 hypothetical protein WGH24286_01534 [Periweissella ghanensis]
MDKQTTLAYRNARQTLAETTIITLQAALKIMEATIIERGGELAEPLVNDLAMTAYQAKVTQFSQISDDDKSNKQLIAEITYFDTIAGDNIADLLGLVEDYPIFAAEFITQINELVDAYEAPAQD